MDHPKSPLRKPPRRQTLDGATTVNFRRGSFPPRILSGRLEPWRPRALDAESEIPWAVMTLPSQDKRLALTFKSGFWPFSRLVWPRLPWLPLTTPSCGKCDLIFIQSSVCF